MSTEAEAGTPDAPEVEALEVGKVSVSPAEFRMIKYDAGEIAGVVTETAEVLGIANPIRVLIDETSALAKMSAEIPGTTSDDTITIRLQSGALEDTKHFTHFSPDAARESVGRMLLRAADRMRDDFVDVPDDYDLTLGQNAAWDAYCVARLARVGMPVNEQRFRYNYRNRFGFSDTSDAKFDRIWQSDELGWDELTSSP